MALRGKKVIELAGLAPGQSDCSRLFRAHIDVAPVPFAGLVLADHGASVIRVDRPSAGSTLDVLCRGKRSITVNSKIPSGRELLKKLIASSDVLIDPYRPGVLERLGLGPDIFLGSSGLNQKLIYARIVGFPRNGPYKNMAGHDLNYLAMTGVLSMLPGSDKPVFPLNLLADFAGGGLYGATQILLALLARLETNQGQVLDIDMVSSLDLPDHWRVELMYFKKRSQELDTCRLHLCFIASIHLPRGFLESEEPIYLTGEHPTITYMRIFMERFFGSLPADFTHSEEWREVVVPAAQADRKLWPKLKEFITAGFMLRSRDEWAETFFGKSPRRWMFAFKF
ncbi:hypothetical protein D9757_008504 [Collybiopsis confluens]|uniref:Alpha-methylacyl-CoA racemase n=1 Tax=Collybiopsis confluens TaxID=2823264 RepID=A0A8H5H2J7_9AGAR|nr:hypothetical protein D9757_008504 [Collybiopsis confluens]